MKTLYGFTSIFKFHKFCVFPHKAEFSLVLSYNRSALLFKECPSFPSPQISSVHKGPNQMLFPSGPHLNKRNICQIFPSSVFAPVFKVLLQPRTLSTLTVVVPISHLPHSTKCLEDTIFFVQLY